MLPSRTSLPDVVMANGCGKCGETAYSVPIEGKEGWAVGCYKAKYPDLEEKANPCKGNEVTADNRRLAIRKWNRLQTEIAKKGGSHGS